MSRSRLRLASSSGAARTSSSSCLIIVPIRMTLAGCSTRSPTPAAAVAVVALRHRHRADRSPVGADDEDLLRALAAGAGCCHASILPRPAGGARGARPAPPGRRPRGRTTLGMASGAGLLDVARVRGLFPGLSDGWCTPTGRAARWCPRAWSGPSSRRMRVPIADRGGVFACVRPRRGSSVSGARHARSPTWSAACRPASSSGPNMTSLTYAVARALGAHLAARRRARASAGWTTTPTSGRGCRSPTSSACVVRWAEVDIETGELPDWQYDELLTDRTRLVARDRGQQRDRHLPRRRRDRACARTGPAPWSTSTPRTPPRTCCWTSPSSSADFLALSAYKWCGPHVGAVVGRTRSCSASCSPDKLVPAPDRVPDRFEQGTPPFELLRRGAAVGRPPGGAVPGRRRAPAGSGCASRWPRWPLRGRAVRPAGRGAAGDARTCRCSARRSTARRRCRSPCRGCARGRSPGSWPGAASAPGTATSTPASCSTRSASNEAGGAVRLGLMHYNTVEEVDHVIDTVAAPALKKDLAAPRRLAGSPRAPAARPFQASGSSRTLPMWSLASTSAVRLGGLGHRQPPVDDRADRRRARRRATRRAVPRRRSPPCRRAGGRTGPQRRRGHRAPACASASRGPARPSGRPACR